MESIDKTMKKTFSAVLAMGLLCFGAYIAAPAAVAHDEDDGYVVVTEDTDTSNPNVRHFKYGYYATPDAFEHYSMAYEAMSPVFKGTYADKGSVEWSYPMLGMTEFDLNNDKVNEIIAFPIEAEGYGDVLCGETHLCPHYVIDYSSGKAKVIGIFPAFAVDRGDDITNGHWTLKAYTKQDDPENFSHFDEYAFDKKTGRYEKKIKEQ